MFINNFKILIFYKKVYSYETKRKENMYNLDIDIFTKNLKYYRKTRNITLDKLGKSINKSKATVSKYERGEIIPDITTVLLICNVLNITLSQLFPNDNKTYTTSKNYNPFNLNKLYFYYYTGNKLILSVGEITEMDNKIKVRFYNGIKNITKYAEESSYYYEGIMECDQTIGYINLYNVQSQGTQLEKIQISFNISWSKKFNNTSFFIFALTPNSSPVVKKGILSSTPISSDIINKYNDDLFITKKDINNILKENAWILEKNNYDHFFYDI